MSQSSFKKQKKNLYDLLKKISLINNVLSINIVGSFEEKKNLDLAYEMLKIEENSIKANNLFVSKFRTLLNK